MNRFRSALHVASALVLVAIVAVPVSFQFRQAPEGAAERRLRLPQGPRVYSIAQAADVWPRMSEARIDPVDVHVGFRQTIEVTVESKDPVTGVTAYIETDNDTVPLKLELVGDEASIGEGVTRGTYRNSWVVRDTHDREYETRLVAEAGDDRSEVVMAWTDACGIPPGGNFTLSTPCTISIDDGIDNGSMTINSSLTLDASFAFNSGFGMTIGESGSLAICQGCQIKKTNIWQIDADADGYPANSSYYLQASAPPNGRRRNLLQATLDCNDQEYSTTNQCAEPQCWPDADGDGYFSTESTTGCGKGSTYSEEQGDDCKDDNADVNPGQGTYFGVDRGDGSFDYDCDGSVIIDPQAYFADQAPTTGQGDCIYYQQQLNAPGDCGATYSENRCEFDGRDCICFSPSTSPAGCR